MTILETLVTSGQIVDIALAFLVIEYVILTGLIRKGRGELRALPLLFNAGAGGSLLLYHQQKIVAQRRRRGTPAPQVETP